MRALFGEESEKEADEILESTLDDPEGDDYDDMRIPTDPALPVPLEHDTEPVDAVQPPDEQEGGGGFLSWLFGK
jgi:hypothetical protein